MSSHIADVLGVSRVKETPSAPPPYWLLESGPREEECVTWPRLKRDAKPNDPWFAYPMGNVALSRMNSGEPCGIGLVLLDRRQKWSVAWFVIRRGVAMARPSQPSTTEPLRMPIWSPHVTWSRPYRIVTLLQLTYPCPLPPLPPDHHVRLWRSFGSWDSYTSSGIIASPPMGEPSLTGSLTRRGTVT
jgi:hypothetical protein